MSPPSFCDAYLNFLARRVQRFLSLVDREVKFYVQTISPFLHLLGIFYFIFIFVRKNSNALHGRLKSQRDGTGGKLTVDPPFSFRRERGIGKI